MPLKNGKTTATVQALVVGSVIPAGTIAPFGGGTVPDGWMLCNGSAISRTTYSALFAAISTTYGSGDGLSTFTLPNAQGVFLRGAGSQTISSVTYSSTRGLTQGDLLGTHRHGVASGNSTSSSSYSSVQGVGAGTSIYSGYTGGEETRPANIGVNYIIKL